MASLMQDSLIKEFFTIYDIVVLYEKQSRPYQERLFAQLPACMKQVRELSHRMTQEELAEALKVDHSYISKIENGHITPSLGFLKKLHDYVLEMEESAR